MSPPAVPEIVVGPVFVTVEPANTPYVAVLPFRISGTAADEPDGSITNIARLANKSPTMPSTNFCDQREVSMPARY